MWFADVYEKVLPGGKKDGLSDMSADREQKGFMQLKVWWAFDEYQGGDMHLIKGAKLEYICVISMLQIWIISNAWLGVYWVAS